MNVLMKLLNPVQKKLHVDSLMVPSWVIFLKPRPFVKWNNAEFTHTSCFTSVMCSAHFKLSGIILIVAPPPPPTSNNFVQFVFAKIPKPSAWWVLYRPPLCWLLPWQMQFIRTPLIWNLEFWYPGTCHLLQEVSVHYFLFVLSVLCKNALKSAQFSRYILPFDGSPQIWVLTEVLVCPICALH
jgi:hypothetical protein